MKRRQMDTEILLRAALYLRISSDPQEASLDSQAPDLKHLCAKKGWPIVATFQDIASGGTDKRSDFQRMLKQALGKAPPFDVIVVWDHTRFGRSEKDAVNLRRLKDYKISVYSYYENRFLDSHDIRDVVAAWSAREDLERKKISVPRGQRAATRKGFIGSGLGSLFGYTFEKRIVNDKLCRLPIPDPETATYARQLFKKFADGDSIHGLAKWLQAKGVPTQAQRLGRKPKGSTHGTWFPTTVRKILANPVYLGHLVYGRVSTRTTIDGELIVTKKPRDEWTWSEKPSHEALVTKEVFEKVQARLNAPVKHRERDGRPPNILQGIGRCKACGGYLSFQLHSDPRKKGLEARRYYWYCRNSRDLNLGGPECKGGLRFEYVHESIVDGLRMLLTPDLIKTGVEKYNAALEDYTGNGEAAALEKKIGKLEREKLNLIKAIKDGADFASVKDELQHVEAELAATREQRQDLEREIAAKAQPIVASAVLAESKSILSAIKKADLDQIRRVLPHLVSRVILDLPKQSAVRQYRDAKRRLIKDGFQFKDHDLTSRSVSIPGKNLAWKTLTVEEMMAEFKKKRSASSPVPFQEMAKQIARLDELSRLEEAASPAVRVQIRYDLANLQTLGEEALEKVGGFISA